MFYNVAISDRKTDILAFSDSGSCRESLVDTYNKTVCKNTNRQTKPSNYRISVGVRPKKVFSTINPNALVLIKELVNYLLKGADSFTCFVGSSLRGKYNRISFNYSGPLPRGETISFVILVLNSILNQQLSIKKGTTIVEFMLEDFDDRMGDFGNEEAILYMLKAWNQINFDKTNLTDYTGPYDYYRNEM